MRVQQPDVSIIVLQCVSIGGSDQLFVVGVFSVLPNRFLSQAGAILLSDLGWVGHVCLRHFLVGSALPKVALTVQDVRGVLDFLEAGRSAKILIHLDPQSVVQAVLLFLLRHLAIGLIRLLLRVVGCLWRSESHVDGLLRGAGHPHVAFMVLSVLGEVELRDFRLRVSTWRKWLGGLFVMYLWFGTTVIQA